MLPFNAKSLYLKIIFVATVFVLFLNSAAASDVNSMVSPNSTGYIVKVILGTGTIVALIFSIAWVIKRFGNGSLLSNDQMKIVGSLPLGTKEKVVMVDLGEQKLVLGVTSNNINTLHKIDIVDSDVREISAKKKPEFDFKNKLQEILSSNCLR